MNLFKSWPTWKCAAVVLGGLLACGTASAGQPKDDDPSELARRAQAVLKTHCHKCHGQDGAAEGGFNYILDMGKLVAQRKVMAGNAEQSPLYRRVAAGKMPPPSEPNRPSAEEIATLKKWIDAGAPTAGGAVARSFISESDLVDLMLSDLEKLDRRGRRFVRYFTLSHLYNAGLSNDELQTYRAALAKLVNSLSWHPKIANPKPVDPHGVLLRIDLRDYLWDANLWNRVLQEYPYGILHDTAAARAVYVNTATRLPYLRADWFIATASRPPLYHELLQLPATAQELERLLRVDVAVSIQQDRVARAGFNGSGVAKNNRLIERHDGVHGAYWKTYDFEAIPNVGVERTNLIPDRRNLFAYPLGPGQLENNFQHAGGEIIYNLPNGLQAYLLVDADGRRIDKAPTSIVSDPKRPDRAVENGISCMHCHYSGILPKADQIRDHVAKNRKAYAAKDLELIFALYPPEEKMKKLMEEDSERFVRALEKTGVKPSASEPISWIALRYEDDLDLTAAAAELGLKPESLIERIGVSESLAKNLGPLKVAGGTVKREVLAAAFGDAVKDLQLGTLFRPVTGLSLPDNTGELDPLEGASSSANAMAFLRGGKLALFASADKTLRVWEVERGIELRRCIGHTASVWCVAVSPNEKWALSGSADGTVRYWKIDTGEEIKKLDGHTAIVTAVAFAPDGSKAVSAGYDHEIILWDLRTFKEVQRISCSARYVNALAFDGKHNRLLIAGDDKVHVIDLDTFKETHRLEGHRRAVTCLAISPDGRQLLSGSDDKTLRLWDLTELAAVRTFEGHEGPVKSVAFSPDGRLLISASADASVRVWDAASGKSLRTFAKHTEGVVQAVFLNDSGLTITGSRESAIKLWQLPKAVLQAVEPPVKGELRPSASLTLGRTLSHLLLSPNGKWLYALDLPERKLLKFDAARLELPAELQLADGVEAIALSPDGKTLFAASASRKIVPGLSGTRIPFSGAIEVIDPARMEVVKTFTVPFAAVELAALNGSTLAAVGAEKTGKYALYLIDLEKETASAAGVELSGRAALRLAADGGLLAVSTSSTANRPGDVVLLLVADLLAGKPVAAAPARSPSHPVGGELLSCGEHLLCSTGTVLQVVRKVAESARPVAAVEPFLAAAADSDKAALFTLARDGALRHYSLPEFHLRGVYSTEIIGYLAAHDPQTGRLYVVGFDPRAAGDKPLARGLGDLFVFDVKPILEGKVAAAPK